MKLIIWLWNPGEKYRFTRHNIGFLFVDYFAEKFSFSEYKNESKFDAFICEGNIAWEKVLLAKPQTFMNLSGNAIHKICSFYKIQESDWIVIYDDKDMDFWKLRLRDKWSSWGQNGIKSIMNHFWEGFNRLKIGIWNDSRYETADWVLSKFQWQELEDLEYDFFPLVEEKIVKFIQQSD